MPLVRMVFKRLWEIVVVLLAGLVLAAGCGDRNVYAPPPPPQVTVSQPSRQVVTDYLEFTGNAQAFNTAQLKARVEGFLEKVYFQDGDLVKKGQVLFLIQPNTYKAKLEEAEAEILRQKAALDHANNEVQRFTKLVKQKAAAQSDLDNWRFQLDSARAALKAAEAKRDLAKLNLDYTRVSAPFNGRIDRRLRDAGNLVGAGEFTLLAEINQIDPIYIYFTMSEGDLLRVMGKSGRSPLESEKIKVPLEMGLANEKGYPRPGYLDFAAISLSPTTGTLQLRGVFPNPDAKIVPGMYARVRGAVVGQPVTDLLVPAAALGYDQQGFYALVVDEKNIVQRRAVTVGSEQGDKRVVKEGLSGDEWIITEGMLRAFPGKPVSPVKAQPAAKPDNTNP